MSEGIRAPNIPLGISLDEFFGFENIGGKKSLRRYLRNSVLGGLETMASAVQAGGGVVFLTFTEAMTKRQYQPNQLAWIVQDTAEINGVYQKVGSSGAGLWSRVAELPYSFFAADNSGAGSANAIQATTANPIPAEKALVVFNISTTNTSENVTVKFNGEDPIAVKTSTGNNPVVGGLIENMLVTGYIHGAEFRLLTDQASAAIQTASENAAAAAIAAAADALNSKNEAALITTSGAVDFGDGAISVQTALDPIKNLADCVVTTRAAMAALDVTKSIVAVVIGEGKKNGTFYLHEFDDFEDDVTADVREGYVVRSTDDDTKVWVRDVQDGVYLLDWFITPGASKLTQSNEFKDAFESAPSGSIIKFGRFRQYDLYERSAALRGHIEVDGNGALINNTTQVAGPYPDSLPILRLLTPMDGSDYKAFDVTIRNLLLKGPRLTTDTTRGVGGYGGDPTAPGVGYPSTIDIPRGRTVTLDRVIASGSFYAAAEIHYAAKVIATKCGFTNHGFAALLIADCVESHINFNTIDDIGSNFVDPEDGSINDGYGINLSTSYNTPDYTTFNEFAWISQNRITRCKRKLIDVHNCRRVIISLNYLVGAGYAHIEAVQEGKDKFVEDIQIIGNKIYNRSDFNSGVTVFACISVGASTPSVNGPINGHTNIIANDNQIRGVTAQYGMVVSTSSTAGTETQSVILNANSITQSVFSAYGIGVNPGSEFISMLSATNNHVYANCTLGHILLKKAGSATGHGNICAGTTGASRAVLVDDVGSQSLWRNILNGAVQDTIANVA